LAFRSNYRHILYPFREKARYWSKIAIFSLPQHSTPQLGIRDSSSEYCHKVPKNQNGGYSTVKKFNDNIIYFFHRFSRYTIPACDGRTDKQTDRHTDRQSTVRAMHTHRAVKFRSHTAIHGQFFFWGGEGGCPLRLFSSIRKCCMDVGVSIDHQS